MTDPSAGHDSLIRLTEGHPLALARLKELMLAEARYNWLRLAGEHGPRTMQMQYHHVEHLDAAIDQAIAEGGR